MSSWNEIICLGRCTVDILSLVDHFPCGDDLIRVIDSSIQGGGPIATAAAAAARLGASVGVIDCIGDDWRGKIILEQFEQQGVTTRLLQVIPGKISTQSVLLVESSSGKRAIINARGDTPEPALTENVIQSLDHCRILHVTGTYPGLVIKAIERVKTHHGLISFDGGAGLYKEDDTEILQQVDILICAQEYARNLTKKHSPQDMLAGMLELGVKIAGVTFGEDGSWFCAAGGNCFHQPAFPARMIIDTTGCGDSFHGAFLFGQSRGYTLEDSVRLASAVGAINAQTLGGRAGLPDLSETEKLIQTLSARHE